MRATTTQTTLFAFACVLFLLFGSATQARAVCGDGILDGGETCDDMNLTPGDGCDASCAIETGYTCPVPGDPCVDINECGAGSDNCSSDATCTNLPGSFSCSCNPGYFGDGVTCDPCPAGFFQDTPGQAFCTPCPVGRFASGTAQTECQECPVGSAQSSTGGTSCPLCGPGEYQDTTGAALCKLCDPGSFQANSGQTECTLCSPGKFQSDAGQAQCIDCAAGTFQSNAGAAFCVDCPAGRFQDDKGSLFCEDCPAGTYQDETGQIGCSACPANSTSPTAAASITSCECTPGYTGTLTLPSDSCDACLPGTYKESTGSAACSLCPAFASSPPASTDIAACLCEAGYTGDPGTGGSCSACAAGEYKDAAGPQPCSLCDGNASSTPASTSSGDCVCGMGFEGDGLSCSSYFVAYKVKAPRTDAGGVPLDPSNVFPKDWVVTLEDVTLTSLDPGAVDNPENFVVKKEKSLLLPSRKDDVASPDLAGLHYLRYQAKPGTESVLPPVDGTFLKPAKHTPRTWDLSNELGTIVVESKKVTALLVPANKDLVAAPGAPSDATHFLCYQVKPAKGAYSEQTPGTCAGSAGVNPGGMCVDDADCGGSAGQFTLCSKPKYRKDLQAFFADQFDDCAFDSDGGISFDATSASGMCLFDLKKVVELCNPINKTAVEGARETEAVISESLAISAKSMLCYQPVLAGSISNADAATLASAMVGDKVAPKQSKHAKRRVKDGSPVYTAPGNLFPAPSVVDTIKQELVCLPTDVVGVSPAP